MRSPRQGKDHGAAPRSRRVKIGSGAAVVAAVAGLALSACGSSKPAASQSAPAAPPTVHTYLTLATGGMVHNKTGAAEGPKFIPGDFTLPAGAKVVLTIYSYDDGSASFASASSPYLKVTGGTETVNGSPVTSVSNQDISHTLTIAALGLNIPIPVSPAHGSTEYTPEVVQFTFTAPAAGTYTWQCFAPCGSGSAGLGGAMATDGYMKGTVTVA